MKKTLIYLFFAANYVVLAWFWWHFSGSFITGGTGAKQLLAIGRLCGLLATQMALTQLILIGRVKWIESVFGLDRLSKIHKWNGYCILALITLHVLIVTNAHAWLDHVGFFSKFYSLLKDYDDVLYAFFAYLILLITIGLSITIVRRKLKYENWYYVHIFNYLTFFLFVLHQLTYGMSTKSALFEVYWLGTYVFVALHIAWFRFAKPLLNFWQQDFTITRVDNMNGVATSVYISGRKLGKFKRRAGQFMILRFLQKGFWWQAHPFSLSWGANNSELRITAKNLGDFTAMMPSLKVGTKVIVDGPHGVFTSQKIRRDKVLLIAGGIGITPLRSLTEELAGKIDLTIIYGAKTKSEAVLLDELKTIQANHPCRLIEIYSNETVAGAEGGISKKEELARLVPDLAERDVFLCGPSRMMDALKRAMMELGLPRKQLHWERFAL